MRPKILSCAFLIVATIYGCKAKTQFGEYSKYKVYKTLESALKNKSEVKILRLHNKGIKDFPEEILQLENLVVLSLYNNEIDQSQNLEVLELRKNNLSSLPKSVIKLKNLKRLVVGYNDLSDDDVKFIEQALPECTVIATIIL